MNILFHTQVSPFSGNPVGGAETSIKLMATLCAERGHSVFWLSQLPTGKLWFTVRQGYYGKIKAYQYRKARGESLPFVRAYNRSWFQGLLKNILVRNKIDIVYCYYDIHFLKSLLDFRQTRKLDFKIIMRMAGMYWYEQSRQNEGVKREFEKVFNEIDAVNYIHPALEPMVEEKFSELGMNVRFREKHYGDIGSSLMIDREVPYANLNNPKFEMVMATRFSNYQKRQDILVEAMARIDKSIPVSLTFIGSGSERDKIAGKIKDLGLSDRISIIPFLNQQELWAKLGRSDLLCHACDYEGLGKIILESMAIGLPVLVSDVAPLNSYISDGENGYLVGNTPEAWASKIEEVYHAREQRTRISKTSIDYIRENYDPEKNIVTYENLFRRILKA